MNSGDLDPDLHESDADSHHPILGYIVITFSEPLMMKYPPGSKGHSFNSVRSQSAVPLSRQYVERSMIGILPERNKTIV